MNETATMPAPTRPQTPAIEKSFVEVSDLTVRFVSQDLDLSVVNGVNFSLDSGDALCLLGESGSGKSVTLRALMRLFPPTARIGGSIRIGDVDVLSLAANDLRKVRGSLVSMIFQEPMTALDPVFTVGQQIAETVVYHEGVSMREAMKRARDLMDMVQVPSPERRLQAYPHELSGGLRQRAMIALALACRPKLLLADEPTTALDATVQIQIILLLRELQKELGMATIFVTHDLGVACEVADRIAVMYAGRFVENGSTIDVMETPRHPYTEGLLRSTIHAGLIGKELTPIGGSPPDLADLPPGCPFAPRCDYVTSACLEGPPALRSIAPDHDIRCIRYDEEGTRS